MGLPLPCSLTPTKVTAFKDCAYAFRLSQIDKIPQPLTIWTVKGVLVHRALEQFYFNTPATQRTLPRAHQAAHNACAQAPSGSYAREFLAGLSEPETQRLEGDVISLVGNLFEIEDPRQVCAIGTELQLESTIGGLTIRGIIDRIDREPDGSLTVVDYKTGRPPHHLHEQDKLSGVLFYALLVEHVLGQRPKSVKLIYLKDKTIIETEATPQRLRAVATRTSAIWNAVTNACATGNFRPRPSRHCVVCSYREICPSVGASTPRAAAVG
ncbi:MAG: RecB family exonuclease [Ferrimicrobium sp.]